MAQQFHFQPIHQLERPLYLIRQMANVGAYEISVRRRLTVDRQQLTDQLTATSSLLSAMFKLVIFLSAMTLAIVSEGSTLLYPKRIMKRGDIRVCGRMLTDTLSLLCNGEYYDPSEDRTGKRDLPPAILDPFQGWYALSSGQPNEADQTDPLPQVYKRYQPGVVDECCRKACSPSTLLSYCRRVD
ncbi:ilGF domain-containing protein [Trichonephila clavipes]|uniref:IlGF domain-containing protein n=1 Tax=Trichonephila clavipes TaxID=2585209 RepID=A0A8X6RTM5_TRICX|nr:ilGF domain-containing protein [Trichonephila clavipes]